MPSNISLGSAVHVDIAVVGNSRGGGNSSQPNPSDAFKAWEAWEVRAGSYLALYPAVDFGGAQISIQGELRNENRKGLIYPFFVALGLKAERFRSSSDLV